MLILLLLTYHNLLFFKFHMVEAVEKIMAERSKLYSTNLYNQMWFFQLAIISIVFNCQYTLYKTYSTIKINDVIIQFWDYFHLLMCSTILTTSTTKVLLASFILSLCRHFPSLFNVRVKSHRFVNFYFVIVYHMS